MLPLYCRSGILILWWCVCLILAACQPNQKIFNEGSRSLNNIEQYYRAQKAPADLFLRNHIFFERMVPTKITYIMFDGSKPEPDDSRYHLPFPEMWQNPSTIQIVHIGIQKGKAILMISQSNGMVITEDFGRTWEPLLTGFEKPFTNGDDTLNPSVIAVTSRFNNKEWFMGYRTRVIFTQDDGNTFSRIMLQTAETYPRELTSLAIPFSRTNQLYIGTAENGIIAYDLDHSLKEDISVLSQDMLQTLLPSSYPHSVTALCFHEDLPTVFYFALGDALFQYTDPEHIQRIAYCKPPFSGCDTQIGIIHHLSHRDNTLFICRNDGASYAYPTASLPLNRSTTGVDVSWLVNHEFKRLNSAYYISEGHPSILKPPPIEPNRSLPSIGNNKNLVGGYLPWKTVLQTPEKLHEWKNSGFNTLVFTVKAGDGSIMLPGFTFPPFVENENNTIDLDQFNRLISELHSEGFVVIARLIAFWDNRVARVDQHKYALRNAHGAPMEEPRNYRWIDPNQDLVQEYIVALAHHIELLEFDAIQLDYFRYPPSWDSYPSYKATTFPMKAEVLSTLLKRLQNELDLPVSLAIKATHGIVTKSNPFGQDIELLAPYLDILSPMFYLCELPSPLDPTIPATDLLLEVFNRMRAQAPNHIILPYLQAFGCANYPYDEKIVIEQLDALHMAQEKGWVDGLLYWHRSGLYQTEQKIGEAFLQHNSE